MSIQKLFIVQKNLFYSKMRRVFITENQYRRILEAYGQNDGVEFGEPVAIAAQQVRFPVSIDGVVYSTAQINFIIEPHILQGVELYQPHIFIAPELQQKGFGYRIYRRFVHEYGNLYSSEWSKTNKTGAIDKIYQRLGQEPDITVIHDEDTNGKYLIAYLSDTEPVNEDVSETMSGIDNRMISLARHIYQNAIKALEINTTPEPISAEEVNNCQNYFKINNPLYVEISTELKQDTVASMVQDSDFHCIRLNKDNLIQKNISISDIMHELTHMVNGICTNYSKIMKYGNEDFIDDTDISDFIQNFCYEYNETEMQARLSEYYHACQIGNINTPIDSNILHISLMMDILDKIENDSTCSYWACVAYKRRIEHDLGLFDKYKYPLYPGQIIPNSPYQSFIRKKKRQFSEYIKKADKIYNYFVQNQAKTMGA